MRLVAVPGRLLSSFARLDRSVVREAVGLILQPGGQLLIAADNGDTAVGHASMALGEIGTSRATATKLGTCYTS